MKEAGLPTPSDLARRVAPPPDPTPVTRNQADRVHTLLVPDKRTLPPDPPASLSADASSVDTPTLRSSDASRTTVTVDAPLTPVTHTIADITGQRHDDSISESPDRDSSVSGLAEASSADSEDKKATTGREVRRRRSRDADDTPAVPPAADGPADPPDPPTPRRGATGEDEGDEPTPSWLTPFDPANLVRLQMRQDVIQDLHDDPPPPAEIEHVGDTTIIGGSHLTLAGDALPDEILNALRTDALIMEGDHRILEDTAETAMITIYGQTGRPIYFLEENTDEGQDLVDNEMPPEIARYALAFPIVEEKMTGPGGWFYDETQDRMQAELPELIEQLREDSAIFRERSDDDLRRELAIWAESSRFRIRRAGRTDVADDFPEDYILYGYRWHLRDTRLAIRAAEAARSLPGTKTIVVGLDHLRDVEAALEGRSLTTRTSWYNYTARLATDEQEQLELIRRLPFLIEPEDKYSPPYGSMTSVNFGELTSPLPRTQATTESVTDVPETSFVVARREQNTGGTILSTTIERGGRALVLWDERTGTSIMINLKAGDRKRIGMMDMVQQAIVIARFPQRDAVRAYVFGDVAQGADLNADRDSIDLHLRPLLYGANRDTTQVFSLDAGTVYLNTDSGDVEAFTDAGERSFASAPPYGRLRSAGVYEMRPDEREQLPYLGPDQRVFRTDRNDARYVLSTREDRGNEHAFTFYGPLSKFELERLLYSQRNPAADVQPPPGFSGTEEVAIPADYQIIEPPIDEGSVAEQEGYTQRLHNTEWSTAAEIIHQADDAEDLPQN